MRRGLRILLLSSIAVFLALAGFAGYELNWIRQRHEAKEWLAQQEASWYAPSLAGARVQASPPRLLGQFGETGVVGIGMDVKQFSGPVPYSQTELERLFPEARVDYSRDGQWIASR
jgi:hypothetical protein